MKAAGDVVFEVKYKTILGNRIRYYLYSGAVEQGEITVCGEIEEHVWGLAG
jgi:hypothetical protein